MLMSDHSSQKVTGSVSHLTRLLGTKIIMAKPVHRISGVTAQVQSQASSTDIIWEFTKNTHVRPNPRTSKPILTQSLGICRHSAV